MKIISLGCQCTNAFFLKYINRSSYYYPFDWCWSNPKAIFELLELLFDKNINIQELVQTHFFNCDKKLNIHDRNNSYISSLEGIIPYNTTHKLLFLHDTMTDNNIQKYIRRFNRLKDDILNSDDELYFLYTSPASDRVQPTVDGENIMNNSDIVIYLNKIYNLIKGYRSNYKLIYFDTINKETVPILNEHIIVCPLNPCNWYGELLPQMQKQEIVVNNFLLYK